MTQSIIGKLKILGWVVGLVLVVVGLMIHGYNFIVDRCGDPSGPGTFGDMFGVVNALFSGLAFGGVILALVYQTKELDNQRRDLEFSQDEMVLAREEMKAQRGVMSLQLSTLERQQFESTFFQMLGLLEQIVSSLQVGGKSNTKEGRDCFIYFLNDIGDTYEVAQRKAQKNLSPTEIGAIYFDFYVRHSNYLGHYFRTLYQIIKYVDESSVDDRYLYVRIVRAQLSSGELGLLLLNCQTDIGKKLKDLVEKYALLKHTPHTFYYFPEDVISGLKREFSPTAFDSELLRKMDLI